MTNSTLPTTKNEGTLEISTRSTSKTDKDIGTLRIMLSGGLLLSASAIGVFVFTQQLAVSVLLALVGGILFGSRQLIKKSLSLSANRDQLLMGSAQSQLEHMKKQVSQCKFLENMESDGVRVADQADQVVQQFQSIKNILSQRFEPSEITFSRYINGVEDFCLSVSENLLHSKNSLEHLNVTSKNPTEEWKAQRERTIKVLDSTDEALNELTKLFNAINTITTKEKHRNQLEQSMQEIKELAERAKIYSKD